MFRSPQLTFAAALAGLLAFPLSAQDPKAPPNLDARLKALEEDSRRKDAEIDALKRQMSAGQQGIGPVGSQQQIRRGISQLGQTTIFDSTFNPAISLTGDFVLAVTDRDDNFENFNQFQIRDIELGIVGRVDPLASYQLYVHFEEDDIEVEEGYLLVDQWLPDTFMLKVGRFNLDFGKMSPIHEHDLPFLDKPSVLQEILGGALRGTGVEVHHYFALGDETLLRWTAGITNGLDGDAHAIFGPLAGEHEHGDSEEDGPEPFGDRDFNNFSFHGRVSALTEVGSEGTLQVGASYAHSPEDRQFFEVTGGGVIGADLERSIAGVDVTYKTLDPQTGSGLDLGVEFLWTENDVTDDGMAITEVDATGFYAYGRRIVNNSWSFGALGGYYEHAEEEGSNSWDAGGFVTHHLDEFNRLRVEARHFDDPEGDSFGLALQWTIILGSHGHGIDW